MTARLLASSLNADSLLEGLLDRTSLSDQQQSLSLLVVKRTLQFNPALDPLDAHSLRRAVLAVRLVGPHLPERNLGALEGPRLSIRVHAQRHRGAAPQRHQQVLVWSRPGVGTAERDRLVGNEVMGASD
jgi:hypothetical protein